VRPGPATMIAPIASATLLVAVMLAGGLRAREVDGVEEYHARVAAAIDAIPVRLDGWIGADIPAQRSALQLLKPNRVFQRRYRHEDTDESISLLVVHCRDVRDMRGHYPPRCYPASGWVQHESDPITLDGIPAVRYSFTRIEEGLTVRLSVINFFLLPDSPDRPYESDMEGLMSASQTRLTPSLGAAQVQILGLGDLAGHEQDKIIGLLLDALRPVVDAISEEL